MKFNILFLILMIAAEAASEFDSTIPCKDKENCKQLLNPTVELYLCVSGTCMCPNMTTKTYEYCSSRNAMLGSRLGLRRSCEKDEDCEYIEGAKCFDSQGSDESKKICDCKPNMVKSADGQKCLEKALEVLSKCEESAQCTATLDGAECLRGACRCRPNFHYSQSSKRCIINRGYGESCKKEDDSCYQLSEPDGKNTLGCSNKNVCKCLKNYVPVNNICQYSDASRAVVQTVVLLILATFTIIMF